MTEPVSYGETVPVPTVPPQPSMLDSLVADFTAAQYAHETTEFDVPGKPSVTVRYANDIPYEMLTALGRSAQQKDSPDLFVALSMLVYACRGLLVDGDPVTDSGEPVTFTSPSLQTRLGVSTPNDACRAFYGKDGSVLATWRAVMLAAGYGAEVSPTKR